MRLLRLILSLLSVIPLFCQSRVPAKGVHFTKQTARVGGTSSGANGIDNHGGPVLRGNVPVYAIWYGNWTGSEAPGILTDLLQSIGGSPYLAINTTYYDASGPVSGLSFLAGAASDSYSAGAALTDADIPLIVKRKIDNGDFPLDPNAVYFVLTSGDVAESGPYGRFGIQYCGWHNHGTVNGVDIQFSFVGDPQPNGLDCQDQSPGPNGFSGADAMASVVAHELEEAITDPDLNAWYDSNGFENADKCAWSYQPTKLAPNGSQYNVALGSRLYRIQRNWVNADGGYCALRYPKTSAPIVSITTPADGQTFSCGANSSVPVTFAATATDSTDGDISSGIFWTYYFNGSPGGPITGPTIVEHFTCNLLTTAYRWWANVTNSSGVAGASSVLISITGTLPPNSVRIQSPQDGASFVCGSVVLFFGAATDSSGNDISSQIQWTDADGGGFGSGSRISRTYRCGAIGTHNVTAAVPSTGAADTKPITILKK